MAERAGSPVESKTTKSSPKSAHGHWLKLVANMQQVTGSTKPHVISGQRSGTMLRKATMMAMMVAELG